MNMPDHAYKTKIGNTTYIVTNYYSEETDITERIGNLIRNATDEGIWNDESYTIPEVALNSSINENVSVDVSEDSRYSVADRAAVGKEDS